MQNESSNSDRSRLILEALERKPLSGKEVQAATSLPLPTVYRYLGELQKIRFIIKDKGTYALTDRGRQLLEVLEKE